ncbi:MAG: hypothetical protein AB7P04_03625 [Bacteriovoracia bacterium]
MNKFSRLGLALTISTLVGGCGGTHPLNVFTNPNSTPSLSLPFATGALVGFTAYSTSTNSITLTVSAYTTPIIVPAPGVVSSVTTGSNGGYSITIYHTSHISTQMDGLTISSLRVGDVVVDNQQLGILPNGFTQFYMRVLLDGQPVCPYSYFSSAARQTLYFNNGGINFCPF